MKKEYIAVAGALALCASAGTVCAQDAGAQKRENVLYYIMYMVDFKPGAENEAWEIIYDHFVPVDNAIDRKVIAFDPQSGGWDQIVYFPIGETTDDLEWTRSAVEASWWSKLVEQEGGEKKAEAMMKRFNSLIAREERHIVHLHTDAIE